MFGKDEAPETRLRKQFWKELDDSPFMMVGLAEGDGRSRPMTAQVDRQDREKEGGGRMVLARMCDKAALQPSPRSLQRVTSYSLTFMERSFLRRTEPSSIVFGVRSLPVGIRTERTIQTCCYFASIR